VHNFARASSIILFIIFLCVFHIHYNIILCNDTYSELPNSYQICLKKKTRLLRTKNRIITCIYVIGRRFLRAHLVRRMDAVNNYTQINDFSAEKRSPAAIIIRISIPQLYSIYVIRYFIIALYCYSNNGARRVFQFFYHRRVHNSASSTRSIRVRYYFFRIQSLRRLCPTNNTRKLL